MKITNEKLKNNLDVLFINKENSNSACVQIWFRAGSSMESENEHGCAHFLEHMFFKGTEKNPGHQIALKIEEVGGEINAFTSFDYTCYYMNVPNQHLNMATNLLMDMVSNPKFLSKDIEAEKEVVQEELKRSLDNKNQYDFLNIQEKFFKKPYDHKILGNKNNIDSFTRDKIIEFRKKYYNTDNCLLIVSGDIAKKDQIKQTIEKYNLPTGKQNDFRQFRLNSPKIYSYNYQTELTQITFVYKSPSFKDFDATAEDLALNCLSYGESSPLFQSLVSNTSLANSASSSTMYFANGGCHFLRIVCPYQNITAILKTLEVLIFEHASNGFSDRSINKIKNQYISSKIFEQESIESYSFSMGSSFAQNGDIYSEKKYIERIKNTSAIEVNESFKKIFSREPSVSIQAPENENLDLVKKLVSRFNQKIKSKTSKIKNKSQLKPTVTSQFDPEVKVYKLKKGVSFVYRRNTQAPTFFMQAFIKGSLNEESNIDNGIFNLISDGMIKGYKNWPYEKLKNDLEFHATNLNSISGKNAFGISMHGLSSYFSTQSKHFFGSLIEPTFNNKLFASQKKIITRHIQNEKNNPVRVCFKEFNQLMFKGHSYSLSSIGSEKSLKSLTAKKIKDKYFKKLKNSELVITYIGDQSFEEVFETIKPYIDKITPKNEQKKINKITKYPRAFEKSLDSNKAQCHLLVGLPAFPVNTKNDFYLRMITILLSGQSSELFLKIRDELSLCYTIQPIHFNALEGGYWAIYIGTAKEKKSEALSEISKFLLNFAEKGLTQNDLEKIKLMMDGQSKVNIQTSEDYSNIHTIPILHHQGVDSFYNNIEKMNSIELSELNSFIKKYFSKKTSQVEVG